MRFNNKDTSFNPGYDTRENPGRKGFTMIEVVITIAVIAILAAVLVPLISQNIQAARYARASSDVKTLGEAIVQFRKDTSAWPIYVGADPRDLLFSDVDAANDGVPDTGSIPPPWNGVAPGDSLSLAYHLIDFNINGFNVNITRGPNSNGMPFWNGPYLSAVRPDPWGNPYVVNAQGLVGSTQVYVVSAGPGRPAAVETPFNGSGPPPAGSDDIVFRLQ